MDSHGSFYDIKMFRDLLIDIVFFHTVLRKKKKYKIEANEIQRWNKARWEAQYNATMLFLSTKSRILFDEN